MFLVIPSSYAKILGETNFQSWEFLRRENSPRTRGWSRLRDRTLAGPKNERKSAFFVKKLKLPKNCF